jgi:hypothetical protein
MRVTSTLGSIILASYIVQTIFSYWLAPAQILFEQTIEPAIYNIVIPTNLLSVALDFYPSLTGIGALSALTGNLPFIIAYCLPIAIATIACAVCILWLTGIESQPTELPRHLYRWSIAFAVVTLPALPVMAQDFWLSAAWGRMTSQGINPYYNDMPLQISLAWFPYSSMHMTYGPLWAIISGAVMLLGDSRWFTFIIYKMLLFAFWVVALSRIKSMTQGCDIRTRCLAIVAAGWLPLSVVQSLGEGHNDIVMASLVILWLSQRRLVLLVAATMLKYLTAPLLIIALIERRNLREYIIAGLLCAGIFGLFYRGRGFFESGMAMTWRFMTPYDALAPLHRWAHLAAVPFFVLAGISLYRYARNRDDVEKYKATVALVGMVLFGILQHIWPWYLILALLPAALVPAWEFSVWIIGLCLAAPFSMIYHLRGLPRDWMSPWPAAIFYSIAFAWLGLIWVATRKPSVPSEEVARRVA